MLTTLDMFDEVIDEEDDLWSSEDESESDDDESEDNDGSEDHNDKKEDFVRAEVFHPFLKLTLELREKVYAAYLEMEKVIDEKTSSRTLIKTVGNRIFRNEFNTHN